MNGVMSKKKMEVITDQPTTWLCSRVVLSRFSFLFCFVLFYTALLPRHTLDTSFSRPLYVIPFFFLLFYLALLGVLPPVAFDLRGCGNHGYGCTTTQTQTQTQTPFTHCWTLVYCTVRYCNVLCELNLDFRDEDPLHVCVTTRVEDKSVCLFVYELS
jgi:hypothetical protein